MLMSETSDKREKSAGNPPHILLLPLKEKPRKTFIFGYSGERPREDSNLRHPP